MRRGVCPSLSYNFSIYFLFCLCCSGCLCLLFCRPIYQCLLTLGFFTRVRLVDTPVSRSHDTYVIIYTVYTLMLLPLISRAMAVNTVAFLLFCLLHSTVLADRLEIQSITKRVYASA